jgi:hypothetical protein
MLNPGSADMARLHRPRAGADKKVTLSGPRWRHPVLPADVARARNKRLGAGASHFVRRFCNHLRSSARSYRPIGGCGAVPRVAKLKNP